MSRPPIHGEVEEHYAQGRLLDAILDALRASGKDPDRLTPPDLEPVAGFHIGGLESTRELAARAAWTPDSRVLDVGCGIGGPARQLALEQGCRVEAIDLTREYIEVAEDLTRRVGLQERITYHCGDGGSLPFDSDGFDVVWTEHVQMNVEDKPAFYREIHRVLRPGGRLLFNDVFAGGGGPPRFPVPWASAPVTSFLVPPESTRELLEGLGFRVLDWEDTTERSAAWFRAMFKRAKERTAPNPLGNHLLMGPDAAIKSRNLLKNLEAGRCRTIQAVMEKAS